MNLYRSQSIGGQVFWKNAICSYVTDVNEIREPERVRETHTDIANSD